MAVPRFLLYLLVNTFPIFLISNIERHPWHIYIALDCRSTGSTIELALGACFKQKFNSLDQLVFGLIQIHILQLWPKTPLIHSLTRLFPPTRINMIMTS